MLCDEDGIAAPAVFKQELEEASHWLESLGFHAPSLLITGTQTPRYVARVADEELSEDAGGRYAPPETSKDVGNIYLSSTISGEALTGEAVHELFHAVQQNYFSLRLLYAPTLDLEEVLGFPADPPASVRVADDHQWITEGTAEAVRMAYAAWAGKTASGRRAPFYDIPLHRYGNLTGKARLIRPYRLVHFWQELGNMLETGTLEHVRYVWEAMALDVDPAHQGLGTVDAAVAALNDGTGLYDVFPEFIAEKANDPSLYQGLEQISLSGTETTERVVNVAPVSGSAFLVKTHVPVDEVMGFSVELDPEAREDTDFHLVVDKQRLDQVENGDERNVFRTAVEGAEEPETFLVRVVNVAESAIATRQKPVAVRFSLQPTEPCSGDMLAGTLRRLDHLHTGLPPNPMPFGSEERNIFSDLEALAEDLEAQQLMPASGGGLRITGAIRDGGVACADPIGDNALFDMMLGLVSEEELEEQMMEHMQSGEFDPEDSAVDRSGGSFLDAFGMKSGRAPWGAVEGSTMLLIYSPQAVSWAAGNINPAAPGDIGHSGLGRWTPNAAASLVLMLPEVPVQALREGETYQAKGVPGDEEGPPAFTYSVWSGEWATAEPQRYECQRGRRVRSTGRKPAPYEDAFQGRSMDAWAMNLEGTVTITEITGAEVRGTLELSGEVQIEAEHRQWVFPRSEDEACEHGGRGLIIGDHTVDSSESSGHVRLEGRFRAPAAAEVERPGRVVSSTRSVSNR